jgi:hypothetical protein
LTDRPRFQHGYKGFVTPLDRAPWPIADDKTGFDVGFFERLKQPHTENCTGRDGEANDQASPRYSFLGRTAGQVRYPRSFNALLQRPAVLTTAHITTFSPRIKPIRCPFSFYKKYYI